MDQVLGSFPKISTASVRLLGAHKDVPMVRWERCIIFISQDVAAGVVNSVFNKQRL